MKHPFLNETRLAQYVILALSRELRASRPRVQFVLCVSQLAANRSQLL
jgi:hypothetical protein